MTARPASVHDFVIVIPVADRPLHLSNCLGSLAELLRRYPYSGDVSVLIVDDSRAPESLAGHRALAETFSRDGPTVHHLDQAAQRALIAAVPEAIQARIAGIVGLADAETFHHKGSSVTRNIAYLWLNRLPNNGRKRLFWSLDSDQEFRVNVDGPQGEEQLYAVDYLHWLDRIFSETPTQILTGKVVGDPPVSPAVMAGTFLDDVLAFLAEMARLAPDTACTFHGGATGPAGEAAYHDMADLFGFKPSDAAWRYRCPLQGEHDHAACFADFAGRLNHFFDGEHPTRRSYFTASDPLAGLQPARTLYTGNYVFTPAALDWFIPFASLKLRMSGPTLGRILRASLGDAFAAANLPMLHKRTVAEMGRSEFRPGVERQDRRVDLSGEFERQYFGDVMLFTMERLCGQGYPATMPGEAQIGALIDEIETGLRDRYRTRLTQTADKLAELSARFGDPQSWWRRNENKSDDRLLFQYFIEDMKSNFSLDSSAWKLIESDARQALRKAAIRSAISQYADDRAAWQTALGRSPA
jgi:hypothetical protein